MLLSIVDVYDGNIHGRLIGDFERVTICRSYGFAIPQAIVMELPGNRPYQWLIGAGRYVEWDEVEIVPRTRSLWSSFFEDPIRNVFAFVGLESHGFLLGINRNIQFVSVPYL